MFMVYLSYLKVYTHSSLSISETAQGSSSYGVRHAGQRPLILSLIWCQHHKQTCIRESIVISKRSYELHLTCSHTFEALHSISMLMFDVTHLISTMTGDEVLVCQVQRFHAQRTDILLIFFTPKHDALYHSPEGLVY